MGAVKGFPSNTALERVGPAYNTISPIGIGQSGQDVVTHNKYFKVDSDVVEASSTVSVVNATAHLAQRGDLIKFTSGTHLGKEIRVASVAANTITLVEDLSAAPATSVTFEILRNIAERGPLDGVHQLSANGATPITTAAYTELTSSLNKDSESLLISNNTTKTLILAVGEAASEVDKLFIPPSAAGFLVPLRIAKGSRVSVKALDANTAAGYIAISVLG